MTLGIRAGQFTKISLTAALFRIVNGLVYASSLLPAAVSSDPILNPKALSDIHFYGLVRAAGLLAQG
jgi:hypothetical protein